MHPITARLLSILENRAFGSDDVSDAQAVKEILDEVMGTDLEVVCCNLFNFISDGDIRMKDRQYRRFQENELDKIIQLLKAEDYQHAKAISFLSDAFDY